MILHTIHTQSFRGINRTYARAQTYSKAWEIYLPDDFILFGDTHTGVRFQSRDTGEMIDLKRIADGVCYAISEKKGTPVTFPDASGVQFLERQMADVTFPVRRVAA